MWRSLEKQDREQSKGNRALHFKVRKFRTVESNMRKCIPRCEFPKAKFRTPLFKVRKFSHRAKHPPGTREAFRNSSQFSHSAKISNTSIQGAKFIPHAKITVQGANSLNVNSHTLFKVRKFCTVRNTLLAHEWHFAHPKPIFAPCETRCENFAQCETPFKRSQRDARAISTSLEADQFPLSISAMAKTGEAFRIPTLVDASTSIEAAHCQSQRLASRPPAKKAKFSGPGEPSQAPQAEPPTEDSQVPVGIPLETVIRRPMIAGPPIEGNLDCRDRSFHSETWFDIEALRQQPELGFIPFVTEVSHGASLTPRQFYYPRVVLDFYQSMTTRGVRNPTLIYFTIDGRQGIIGARHIAEALRIPYEPVT
ncbi:hypothetical protein CK203_103577 [Vitis vinifera]|uniref:Uncharacterized protein n=1 Tax=Vitis vinifera TaxID=29760 RepID=A0A438D1H4_VITVI|nr:hypothetical protein CK203_103577 [Vitis vinifera]